MEYFHAIMPPNNQQKTMVRTRFAPSPTGYLHIGGLRTALYNYLYAKKNNGTFLLRIEDTDQKRFIEGAAEHLIDTLAKVGLSYDEGPNKEEKYGPYIQSQRTDLYRKYVQELLYKKAAYHCFCTSERLEEMRAKQTAEKKAPMYDRTCLHLSPEEIEQKKAEGIPFVIRQLIPHEQKFHFNDLIRDEVNFNTSNIDDQVLMKSDNFPTYHLANVIDDHLMEITHVIRGEEWLPSTPKHILLYQAFGWKEPVFAHIPLLLNADKSKLSKRQGDVSVESYLEKGYSPEAIINFIALLGWHPGDGAEEEIFSLNKLVESFSLERVHKAGAIFDIEKLNWFNYKWVKPEHFNKLGKTAKEIDPASQSELNQKGETVFKFRDPAKEAEFNTKRGELLFETCSNYVSDKYKENHDLLIKALLTVEDKILKSPAEVNENISFFFELKPLDTEMIYNPKMKVTPEIAKKAVDKSIKVLENLSDDMFQTQQPIQERLLSLVGELELKNGQLLWPLRVALTHEQYSPGVFEIIWALGKEESLKRIRETSEKI